MGYNCVVCVKQVPDTKRITGEAMKEDGTVNRGALPAIFNPEDLYALEQALSVRDAHGGAVTVVTMGLPAACEVLREALYRGADRVVLLTDRRAAASDTLATSYILSRAVARLEPDIVFCGRQAIDGDTAQVGPQLAEKLSLPLITYLEELICLEGGKVTVKRNVGNGWEVVKCKLPVLITVMETPNAPRPPAARRLMKYKKAKSPAELAADGCDQTEQARRRQDLKQRGLLIEQWNLDDVGADLAWCGRSGSPTKVHSIQSVVLTGGEYHEFSANQEGIRELVGALNKEHTIG